MDTLTTRLTDCFQTVFPDIPRTTIPLASQSSVEAWDSTAAILLVNVIEEEFAIRVDLDRLEELDSFERIHRYVDDELRKR